ncbi:C39 family peptidase [Catelliglobosispora koreensis]|uniref:C39 family peptidase n=1 Tax=Catelliglobosispora koreensis TaxID=129052 RepID=UPI0003825151|nr:C39 family peptidase [Catelliglobosispora koreensis]
MIALHRFKEGFDAPQWTSPQLSADFAATELIASWTASTPGASYIRAQVRGTTVSGALTKWFSLGEWAATDEHFTRTSVPGQGDEHGTVNADTFRAQPGHALASWQLRITCVGGAVLHSAHLMASALPGRLAASEPLGSGRALSVPSFAQRLHRGLYPQWDGGGQSWCSPTSTSMILAYWGTGPKPVDYAWVDPSYVDPWVIHAARSTYDTAYGGCGNWPFNTAYAGTFGLEAFVTRLRSLNEAALFIEAGIPLIASATYQAGQVPGLNYGTNGHLMVLSGFTDEGDPILHDPASDSNAEVCKPVGRREWESAWLNTSGGVVYVIHPASHPLPPSPGNW